MRLWRCVGALLAFVACAHAAELPEFRSRLWLTSADTLVCLGVPFVQSVTLLLDSLYPLQTPLEYELLARRGCVRFTAHFRRLFRYRDTLCVWVVARYVPLFLSERRTVREDTGTVVLRQVVSPPAPLRDSSAGWRPRGRLVRGFTVQTGSGVVLQSGLELGFQSQLSEQTEVAGHVVASHLPATPEGGSISLQELEQFSLQVRSAGFRAEVGELTPVWFGDRLPMTRLQGIQAAVRLGAWQAATLVGFSQTATRTVVIQGRDGVAGPYPLREGWDAAVSAIVPGSERVWVNGVLRRRGEDYVIDYWRAELTFQPRCPVTSGSRILVEFATVEEPLLQTVGMIHLAGVPGGRDSVEAAYVYRSAAPLQEVPLASPVSVRNGVGYAVVDGAMLVGVDTATGRGRGWYRQRDTVVEGMPSSIWEYAPGAPDARYVVEFHYVGAGRGDYELVAAGIFRYVGRLRGSYAPGRYVPLPSQQQLWHLRWNGRLGRWWDAEVRCDYSLFQPDRRRAERWRGTAVGLQSSYGDSGDTASASFLWRGKLFWQSALFPEQRSAEQEHLRWWWNLPAVEEGLRERFGTEHSLRTSFARLQAEALWGWMRWGELSALRWGAALGSRRAAQGAQWRIAYAGGRVGDTGQRWQWHRLWVRAATDSGTAWRLSGELRGEWQRERSALFRQGYAEGQMEGQWCPKGLPVAVVLALPWRWQWEPEQRLWWQPAAELRWRLSPWEMGLRMGWNEIRQRDSLLRFPLLVWQGRWSSGEQGSAQWRYEAGSGLVGSFLPLFLQVAPGQGGYRYRGDLNGNGVADPWEFEAVAVGGDYVLVPTQVGSSLGVSVRADGAFLYAVPSFSRPALEWESRGSFFQRRYPGSFWQNLVPVAPSRFGVVATQWEGVQRIRIRRSEAQWQLEGQGSGMSMGTGTAWQQWYRYELQLRLQHPLSSAVQWLLGAGPMWQGQQGAGAQDARLAGMRGLVGFPWTPREGFSVAPQLLVLYGRVQGGGRTEELVNLVGSLGCGVHRVGGLSGEATLRYGAMKAIELPAWLFGSEGFLRGVWLQGSLSYQMGSTVWSVHYLGTRSGGRSWWQMLNGQVQLIF